MPSSHNAMFTSKGMGVFRFSAALIEWSKSELNDVKRLCVQAYKNAWHLRHEDVSKNIMLAGLNRTLDEWLCDSFVELIEEIELWKWDDATGDF